MAKRKTKWQIYLEKKYMQEVLGGANYIDARQKPHFRKWAKKQPII